MPADRPMKPIPVSAGERIAKDYGYDQVIIVARRVGSDPVHRGEHCTTYGINREHCDVAAKCGRYLQRRVMGWHDDQKNIHADDLAVNALAAAMKAKLAAKRAQGYGKWSDKRLCTGEHLSQLLRKHVGKGNPVDVANFAMMLHHRGETITPDHTVTSEAMGDWLMQINEYYTAHLGGTDGDGFDLEAALEKTLREVMAYAVAQRGAEA